MDSRSMALRSIAPDFRIVFERAETRIAEPLPPRATRDVDVNRENAIAAPDNRIAVAIAAAAVHAGTHRDHVSGLRRLIANLAEGQRRSVGQRTCHDLHVRMTW